MKFLSALLIVFSAVALTAGNGYGKALDLERIHQEMQEQQETSVKASELAREVSFELKETRKKIVKATQGVQEYEASLTELERQMYEIEKEQDAIKAKLEAKNKQLQTVLAGLEIVAQRPTEALFVTPMSPEDTLRSALLIKGVVPAIENICKEMRQELILLASVKAAIRSKGSQIKMAYVGLEEKTKQLNKLIRDKKRMQFSLLKESKRAENKAKKLAVQAKDMAELIAKLDAERKAKEEERKRQEALARKTKTYASSSASSSDTLSVRDFERAKGTMPFPAKGRITESYGDLLSSGLHAKGLTLQTRSGAQVISPNDGVVLFAGTFKGYGNLLIIEHAEGYHTLLSGMESMDVEEGQNLLAGEPVGTMGKNEQPSLYVEMRKNGQPVNPLPWLAFKS